MDVGTLLYYGALALWSGLVAYTVVVHFFKPNNPKEPEPTPVATPEVSAAAIPPPIVPDRLMQEGFRSFQTGAELTVEDIVKGLSRKP